jgi:peroxiredoxin
MNKWFSVEHEDIPQVSFLINVAGDIEKIYNHIKPEKHASEVIADFMKMRKEDREGGL